MAPHPSHLSQTPTTQGATADYCASHCQQAYSYNASCGIPPPPPPPPAGITVVTQCVRDDVVAITFDDGPYEYSSAIASAFTAAGGNATFFVCGRNYACIFDAHYSDGLLAAFRDGHQIGSHTWDHADLTTLSGDEIAVEVTRINDALHKVRPGSRCGRGERRSSLAVRG